MDASGELRMNDLAIVEARNLFQATDKDHHHEYMLASGVIEAMLSNPPIMTEGGRILEPGQIVDYALAKGLKEATQFSRWVDGSGFHPDSQEVMDEFISRVSRV